ncbi:MAG: hypothetical protein ACI4DU_06670 [Lachnospiraceae bacterium]
MKIMVFFEGQVSDNGNLFMEDEVSQQNITTISENVNSEEELAIFDTETEEPIKWDTEPDLQDTLLLRMEGDIMANEAWVSFLKGEMPDYTGIDFSDYPMERAYTLQDMEGYSLDSSAYGQTEFVEDGGRLTDIQIFPFDVDMDEEDELLFVCNSCYGLVKTWMLDEIKEDVYYLIPFLSNWVPPVYEGRVWLWSNGYICFRCNDIIEDCPKYIHIYQYNRDNSFKLIFYSNNSKDATVVYFLNYSDETVTGPMLTFDYNGIWIDDSPINAENVCSGMGYDEDLAVVTQIYENIVGDAVPIRELTGLEGNEEGIIVVTREEFYNGSYLH